MTTTAISLSSNKATLKDTLQVTLTSADTDNQVISMWLSGKAKTTIKTYGYAINQFFNYAQVGLREITVDILIGYMNWLESRNYAQTTIKNKVTVIKSLLSYAHKIGYLQFNAGLVVQPKARPNALHERILGDGDVRQFLSAIENKRDRLLFSTIYLLGLRISECLGIKKKDIYQVGDGSYRLYILGKGSKERVLSLPQSLALELLAAGNDELVFPSRSGKLLTRSYVHKLIKQYSAISGLSEFLSCHWLRHTHATTAIENGCDLHVLQASLGHSSLAITSKYLHVRGEQSSCSFVTL